MIPTHCAVNSSYCRITVYPRAGRSVCLAFIPRYFGLGDHLEWFRLFYSRARVTYSCLKFLFLFSKRACSAFLFALSSIFGLCEFLFATGFLTFVLTGPF